MSTDAIAFANPAEKVNPESIEAIGAKVNSTSPGVSRIDKTCPCAGSRTESIPPKRVARCAQK
jgi:hypothetical protein